jgi:hypothetical protein
MCTPTSWIRRQGDSSWQRAACVATSCPAAVLPPEVRASQDGRYVLALLQQRSPHSQRKQGLDQLRCKVVEFGGVAGDGEGSRELDGAAAERGGAGAAGARAARGGWLVSCSTAHLCPRRNQRHKTIYTICLRLRSTTCDSLTFKVENAAQSRTV